MTLLYPWRLLFLLIYIPLIVWYVLKWKNSNASIGISSVSSIRKYKAVFKIWVMHFCFVLELVSIGALIVALARPQTYDSYKTSTVEGTDIVLALDISSSMLAKDIQPNRLNAAKDVASKFISNRPNDNIGLVVFSGESLSLMPLTTDKSALINAIANTKTGDIQDGTAIGDGLTSAINRLISGQAKSKSIILLTDGTNNAGEVDPATAANIAKQKGIRVYAIGAGTNGSIKIQDPYGFSTTTMETKIDEDALKNIANVTGGKYFRATDAHTLKKVFEEIDSLEKSRINVNNYSQAEDDFMPWLLISLCSYVLFFVLRYCYLRRLP